MTTQIYLTETETETTSRRIVQTATEKNSAGVGMGVGVGPTGVAGPVGDRTTRPHTEVRTHA